MTENDGTLKCEWCPCIFFTQEDLDAHIRKIGKLKYDHVRMWKQLMEEGQKFG